MDFLKQIHVEFNGLGQPRSSKETAHIWGGERILLGQPYFKPHIEYAIHRNPQPHALLKFHEEIIDKTKRFLRSLLLGVEKPKM